MIEHILLPLVFFLFCCAVLLALLRYLVKPVLNALGCFLIDTLLHWRHSDIERFFERFPKVLLVYFQSLQAAAGFCTAVGLYSITLLFWERWPYPQTYLFIGLTCIQIDTLSNRMFNVTFWLIATAGYIFLVLGLGIISTAAAVTGIYLLSVGGSYLRFHGRRMDEIIATVFPQSRSADQ